MNWSSWAEFWDMGGYGLYVWGSYFCVFAWVMLEPLFLRNAHKRVLSQLSEDME